MRKLKKDHKDMENYIFEMFNCVFSVTTDTFSVMETLLHETHRRFIMGTTEEEIDRQKNYLRKVSCVMLSGYCGC